MPIDATQIDDEQLETDPWYATSVRDVLAAALTESQRNYIDGCCMSGREAEILNCPRYWTSFQGRNEVWTDAMQRYWQCRLTIHYMRARRPEKPPGVKVEFGNHWYGRIGDRGD